jgi:hypothetical protein
VRRVAKEPKTLKIMNNLIIPRDINFLIDGLEDSWLDAHPLLFKIKTFAKNKVNVGENTLWGRSDYMIAPLIVGESIVSFNQGYIESFTESIRDMSGMEFLPVETHYSLVEIELMTEKEVNRLIGNYKTFSEVFFPYNLLLGTHKSVLNKLNRAGNALVHYRPFHKRIRDVWSDGRVSKSYEFKLSKK